jgi:hypothetical protein
MAAESGGDDCGSAYSNCGLFVSCGSKVGCGRNFAVTVVLIMALLLVAFVLAVV